MAEKNYNIQDGVDVTEQVVAVIAGLAATETEGVAALNGGLTNDLVAKASKSRIQKAIRIVNNPDESITVQIILAVKYGFTILDVSTQVQEKVKSSIENMTDITVSNVDVKIQTVSVQ